MTGSDGVVDLTPVVLDNIGRLGLDVLVTIGGDDTLSFSRVLFDQGIPLVAIPKTMDNDVAGTEYCIGFSTAITRAKELINRQRTTLGSHERIGVFRIFGRDAGFSALYTAYVTSARCLIPEAPYDLDRLAEILVADREANPSRYAVVVTAEGAIWQGARISDVGEADSFGHRHKANVGEALAIELRERTGIESVASELTYDLRSGEPDALDAMVATTFANVAMDLLRDGVTGRMVAIQDGKYAHTELPHPGTPARRVDVADMYNEERFRPALRGQARRSDAARRRRWRDRRGRPGRIAGGAGRWCGAPARCLARQPRSLPDDPGERRHVVVGVAAADQLRLELRGELGDRQVRAHLPGEAEGDPEVLPVERDLEPERVVVDPHPLAPVGEDPALGGAAAERLDDLADVEAGLDRQDDALRDAEVRPREDHLVDGLHRLARAARPDVGDRLAHRLEDRPGALDVGGLAAAEDRERRLLGALAPARHGRVDEGYALLAEARREVAGVRRRDRRAVDDEQAVAGAAGDAVRAEEDRLDVRRVGDADHESVDVAGDIRGRA